ncbi:MAG TPA: hypothetical protein VFJ74_08010 [Gemmatimonadaceae bacterium]|nr:hypothetical protein [Gemmatimonadaceae bacterium]
MTASLPPVAPAAAAASPPLVPQPSPPPPPLTPVRVPVGWLLDHAAAPIKYRTLAEIVRPAGGVPAGVRALPYTYRPALLLALGQSLDGTWNQSMLGVPSSRAEHFEGVGTVSAVRRLIEYGWEAESPPLARARRILFRLLAEDNDPAYLFDFAKGKGEEPMLKRGRMILREAAAAALAQAGYENDPRLRGAARRILDRIANYLRSPLSQKPWVRVGNKQVLATEASPPSYFALTMLAYMPLFRSEHHDSVERLYRHLTQPEPRQESAQLVGGKIVPQPHLVLGDMLPHRNAVDADVPAALNWLELMARLGYLRRNENWGKMFERFVDDRDREGVWHPHKGMAAPRSSNPFVWPTFPLEESTAGGEDRWTDVTFRIGLIARVAGRPIEVG